MSVRKGGNDYADTSPRRATLQVLHFTFLFATK